MSGIWGAHTPIGPEKQASKPATRHTARPDRRMRCDQMSACINFFCIPAAPPWNDIADTVVGLRRFHFCPRRTGGFSAWTTYELIERRPIGTIADV
jgi:hypothetical protein